MRIQSIQNYPCSQICYARKTKVAQNSMITTTKPKTPLLDGLSTFGAWFGFGVGLDIISRKCQFSKSPMKNSLAINGLIGTIAGLFAFWQDKKISSKENV